MFRQLCSKGSLAMIAVAGLTTMADANTSRFFSATNCAGNTAPENNLLGRFKEGCFNYFQGPPSYDFYTNLCGPTPQVALPISGNTSDTVDLDSLAVSYVNSSFSELITCTAFVQNASGTMYASSTQTSAWAPNLTSPVSGTLTWTGTALPNAGASIANVRTQNIFCTIPSRYPMAYEGSCFTSSSYSYITYYMANTVAP